MAPVSAKPRQTPLTVKIAYSQLVLAAAGLALAPIYALRAAYPSFDTSLSPFTSTEAPPANMPENSAAPAANDALARGEAIFNQTCFACHQTTGQGIPGVFPPLAGSDFLLADPARAVGVVLNGLSGPVNVNGTRYESAMPPMPLNDEDAAAVVSYVLQAWGNRGPVVTAAEVSRIRASAPTGP